jgi:hypothetical protein
MGDVIISMPGQRFQASQEQRLAKLTIQCPRQIIENTGGQVPTGYLREKEKR